MNAFETLFGVNKTDVKSTSVLLPLLSRNIVKRFGVPRLSRGTLYSAGNSARFTLIRTGVGSALAGDAVLYLADTRCETVILFGSCGLVDPGRGVRIGSLLSPGRCYAAESFTRLLEGYSSGWKAYYPDRKLQEHLLNAGGAGDIMSASCLSIGSLKLQDAMRGMIGKKRIQAVDMECASVFAAAARTGLRAAALLYVSDVIGEKPFHEALSREDSNVLALSMREAIRILCEFIEKKLSG